MTKLAVGMYVRHDPRRNNTLGLGQITKILDHPTDTTLTVWCQWTGSDLELASSPDWLTPVSFFTPEQIFDENFVPVRS